MLTLLMGFCAGTLTVSAIDDWGDGKDLRAFFSASAAVLAFIVGFLAR